MGSLVEIIGLAGSGKSTLAGRISAHFPHSDVAYRMPRIRTMHYQVVALWVHLILVMKHSRRGTFMANLKLVLYIDSLSRHLGREKHSARADLVFDQGVIYAYASLSNIGLKGASPEYLDDLYGILCEHYFPYLDEAVFLNASERVLRQRILDRDSDHRLKGFSESEMVGFFRGYSSFFIRCKADLRRHDVAVIDIETESLSPEQVFVEFLNRTRVTP